MHYSSELQLPFFAVGKRMHLKKIAHAGIFHAVSPFIMRRNAKGGNKMKQIAKRCMLLWMLSLLLTCPAMAEEAPKEEDAWYAFSAENTVVTVRLPSNTKTGLVWEYEISAPEIMELITGETIVGPG